MKNFTIFLLVLLTISSYAQLTVGMRDNAGLQGNAGANTGFFQTYNPTNYPTGASSWWHLLDIRHSNPGNNYALQISGSFFDQNLWFRKTNNNPSTPWRKIVAENENGNVGIGTATPTDKLTIEGGHVNTAFSLQSTGNWNDSQRASLTMWASEPHLTWTGAGIGNNVKNWNYTTGAGGITVANNARGGSYIRLLDNSMNFNLISNGDVSKQAMTILESGFVGIGSSNPDKLLTLKADSFIGWKYTDDSSTSHHTITGGGLNPISFTVNPFSDPNLPIFKFNGSSGTKMSILNGGNVGIGSSNPDEKLTVKGKIHAEEVKIDLAIPADYVFQKYYSGKSSLKADYTMPTLEEVEEYTKINEHLPSIPSAADIKKNGVQLGEMSNLLLQKIEELTLYMIEFKKEMNDVKHELITIKAENKALKETICKK